MSLDDRLALVCLRAVVQDLESSGGAGEVLARVLSRADASGTIARSVAPSADSDLKPAKITSGRRPKRRPAPAARANKNGGPRMGDPEDVRRLAQELLERHGSVRAAADALGVSQGSMRRLIEGRATAKGLDCLRAALAVDDSHRDVKPANATESEAAALVAQIEERHGLTVACDRFGLDLATLRRWRSGAPCSPRSLERLRQARDTAPFTARERARREGREVEAAPEAALPQAGTSGAGAA